MCAVGLVSRRSHGDATLYPRAPQIWVMSP